MPTVPVSVWEQMGVVVLYTVASIIVFGLLIRNFTRSIDKIEANHANVIKGLHEQYMEIIHTFEARWQEQAQTFSRANDQIVSKLEGLTETIEQVNKSVRRLNNRFEDRFEDKKDLG